MISGDSIGERLKNARIEAGYKQKEAAQLAGISSKILSNYETGETKVDVEVLRPLCRLYGISSDEIIDAPIESAEAMAFYRRFKKLSEKDRAVIELLIKGIEE